MIYNADFRSMQKLASIAMHPENEIIQINNVQAATWIVPPELTKLGNALQLAKLKIANIAK